MLIDINANDIKRLVIVNIRLVDVEVGIRLEITRNWSRLVWTLILIRELLRIENESLYSTIRMRSLRS